ncbi:helix-turn-helix domain-containing protein [Amycolatopsis sp. MtRt-6]|uniref:nSTAND1 domain-containing NTPase n=1 Tax=Amycolatopsis sp. MtRt-6 TaxID=2792782 RepID=UPI001A90B418|nr:helix-turn-helix domain-containing protein [Amycolatopsis sp. MtRt-6]
MPRPERPLNAGDGPVAGFAAQLRQLRQRAGGPGYRELARRAHYSPTTLAEAARGERFPSLAVTVAYVRACGGAADEWKARWHAVSAELAALRAPAADDDESAPYLGLSTFQAEDADRFFGREQLVAELAARVSNQPFTAVFGASGVGKSSLLRAGLGPRLSHVVVMTPGPDPVEACASWLTRTSGEPLDAVRAEITADPHGLHRMVRKSLPEAGDEFVVIVDQFEEVFTLCRDETVRAAFIAMLTAVTREPFGPVRVVLGVRADFLARCAEHSDLVAALRDAQVLVGPLSPEELRQVIVNPARENGYVLEGALVTAMVAEATGQAGALPLVSHALLQTWRRRRGNTLTLAGYQAAGGIDGALAATAERTYAALADDQQRAAKDLFLRLTAFGEEGPHTRRRIARAELEPSADPLLDVLARERLITIAESTVDLAHEALIRAWPRLGGWLVDDRDGLRVHRQLTEAARGWTELDRDDGALYRGARLAIAREWAADHRPDLTSVEREFLDTSGRHADAAAAEAARRARVLHRLTAGLSILLVIAVGLSFVAWQQRRDAVAMHRIAVSRQVAGQAVAMRTSQPDMSKLLSTAAFRMSPTMEAHGAVLSTAAAETYQSELLGHTDAISEAVFSGNGTVLATVSRDQTLALWDVTRRELIARLTGHDTWLRAVALSPDGRYAITGGDDATAVVWNLDRRTKMSSLTGHRDRIRAIVFSPDGRTLVTADDSGTILFWETGTWTPTATATVSGGRVRAMSVTPDGRTLVIAVEDGHAHFWDLPGRTARFTIAAHSAPIADLAISPDGEFLATVSYDRTVGLWRPSDGGAVARMTGHSNEVRAVAFTPEGRSVVSTGIDHTVMVWDIRMRVARARMTGLTHNVYALAVHPRTGQVASVGEDRKIVLWDLARPTLFLAGEPNDVGDVSYSPDGRVLATAGGSQAMLWDAQTRSPLAVVPGAVDTVAFSADSRYLAASGGNRSTVDIWDTRRMTRVAELTGHRDAVLDLEFSAGGAVLASSSIDRTVMLWDTKRWIRTAELLGHTGAVNGVTFSPDGRTLATAGHDELVMLWDVRNARHLVTLIGHQSWVRNVRFSPDGRVLASSSIDRTVRLWNVAERRPIATLTGHADAATGIDFSRNGRLLAFTSEDQTVSLWDVEKGASVARLSGHTEPAAAVTFSPDSGTLASVGRDHTAILWSTRTEEAAARVCSALGRDLTTAEWQRFIPDIEPFPVCPLSR